MANYILIHGAWHGSWCWKKVSTILSDQGHRVFSPDLPGHGENKKPHSEVKFQDYIECIMNTVSNCDELPILVGHSFAGMILTQLAANFPGRFKKLIYIAGYVPFSGDSLLSLSNQFCVTGLSPELVVDKKNGSIILKNTRGPELLYHCAAAEDQVWAMNQIAPEPLTPLATPVSYSDFNYADIETLYIYCEVDRAITLPDQKWMAERTQGFTVSLQSDHSPFLGMPNELASFLL